MKKGYTLIELMAVIVILAILSIILVPTITDLIDSARMASAKASAQGYIDAVSNEVSLSLLKYEPLDGTRTVSELADRVSYRGKRIDDGFVIIAYDEVKTARLCVDGYSFEYANGTLSNSNDDYCKNESNLDIFALGTNYSYTLVNQHDFDFDLAGIDMSPATNVVCNNSAVPSIVNNALHINNIYGYTKCSIESSVATTFDNVDETTNTILMLANDSVNNDVTLSDTSDVVLDLNGKTIDLTSNTLTSEGKLDINGTAKGTITSSVLTIHSTNDLSVDNANIISTEATAAAAIYTSGKAMINSDAYVKGFHAVTPSGDDNSEVIINGATIEGMSAGVVTEPNTSVNVVINDATISGGGAGVVNNGSGNITINGGTYSSVGVVVINALTGNISINGGTFTAANGSVIYAAPISTGTIDIEDVKIYCVNDATNPSKECDGVHNDGSGTINLKNEFYIEDLANSAVASRGIYNSPRGTINITGNPAVLDGTSYVSGSMTWSNNGYAVYSDGGTVNIDGGMYVSTNNGGVNASGGVLNITNAYVIGIASESNAYEWRYAMVAANNAILNVNDNVVILNNGNKGYSNVGIMNEAETSTVNINGTQAVLDENGLPISGVFIMTNSGQGIRNAGTVNINGVTIRAAENGFSNISAKAIGNIKNADIATTTYNMGVRNEIAGATLNICSSKIYAEKFDISNNVAATVNYSSDVIFTNGTNTPKIHNTTGRGTINSNYICP